VQSFATSQGNGQPVYKEPSGLTFANDGTSGSLGPPPDLYGGMFGTAPCIDYWSSVPQGADRVAPKPGNMNGWGDGVFYSGSDVILDRTNLNKGHITLYVDGDVYIKDDIAYDTNSAWTSPDQIPSFRLIVHGVIYIDKGVKQLDGLYAAIPDGDYGSGGPTGTFSAPLNGTISTCSQQDGGSPVSYDPTLILTRDSTMKTDCDNPLVFNGSVSALQLWLLRTGGDVGGAPAETFNYTPDTWMAPAAGNGSAAFGDYDSVIGLPPVL
jgi:hypothetical protein